MFTEGPENLRIKKEQKKADAFCVLPKTGLLECCETACWPDLAAGYSQAGICLLAVSRTDSFPTWQIMIFWGLFRVGSLSAATAVLGCELQHQRFLLLDSFSSCCIRFCQKAALEKLLISGRFMARSADCAPVARLMIYNYECDILMAPGVWFRKTIKCTLASLSLQEAK